ncbi:Cof-type HAD-IIB family hydrolase [Vibrio maritimus]|uniref:Cof-type HAD-IIB family hydrolase n=1 Tax=Vibrio maritimus TaxID=990268 RepID=UPI003736E53A
MTLKTDIKLIACDLDGTLLSKEKRIPEFTSSILRQAQELGFEVAFATGRHFLDARAIATAANLSPHFVTINGAQVHLSDNTCLEAVILEPSLVAQIIAMVAEDEDINTNLYGENLWYVGQETQWLRYNAPRIHLDYQLIDLAIPPLQGIHKIYFTSSSSDKEVLPKLEMEMKQAYGEKLSICFSSPFCLEIMSNGVHKKAGLQTLAQRLDISCDQVLAFGDGMNDVEMLAGVGHGLLMGDAAQRVVSALSQVEQIGTSEEQAVAHFIKEHLL